MNNKYELGRVYCHPLKMAWNEFTAVLKTWKYCRKNGIQTHEWWGVYNAGSHDPIAKFGNMPGAKVRAEDFRLLMEYRAKEEDK